MAPATKRPSLEVADIFREHGEEYRRLRAPSPPQRKVMHNIECCRTEALGGHKDTCDTCGYERISYNSCRDRHCPKCQNLKKDQWLKERRQRLLPIPYFHVVFTLPAELNALVLGNKRLLLALLFKAAAKTLHRIAADKDRLGAQIGFTSVLHTWGQNLHFHPHLHCVVTGGGLSPEGDRWVSARQSYFLPVEVLAQVFRGKFLQALRKLYDDGRLKFSGSTRELADSQLWRRFIDRLYRKNWIVDARAPFGGPEHVFRYLGRYTHRVAISNHRLISLRNGKVRFRFKDYADGAKQKTMTLEALEFIRRFLLHVLPTAFVRIRHYGLLAPRNIDTKFARARELLGKPAADLSSDSFTSENSELSWWERLSLLTGEDLFACPRCHIGRLIRTPLHVPPEHHPREPACSAVAPDTS